MNELRYDLDEYSKGSSKEYTGDVSHSHSMGLSLKIIQEVLENYFESNKDIKILEIGGGHGSVMQVLKEEGYDTSSVTNNENEYHNLTGRKLNPILCDMHNLNKIESKFDLILISHVFEHSFAPYVLMTEFNEVLKNNAIVVIIVPNQDHKWVYESYHYIVPTKDQLKNLGIKTGFKCLECDEREYLGMNHLIYVGQKERYWKDE